MVVHFSNEEKQNDCLVQVALGSQKDVLFVKR